MSRTGSLTVNYIAKNKKDFLKRYLFLTLIFIVLTAYVIFSAAVGQATDRADKINLSSNKISATLTEQAFADGALKSELEKIDGVSEVYTYASVLSFGGNKIYINGEGKGFSGAFAVNYADDLPEAYYEEAEAKGIGPLITEGRLPESADEAVCTQSFLRAAGIADYVGTRISLSTAKADLANQTVIENFIIRDVKIVGVISDDYYSLDVMQGQAVPEITVLPQNIDFDNSVALMAELFLDSYFGREDIAEKAKALLPENCSVAALSSSEIMEGLEAQRRTVNAILLTGGILLAAAFTAASVYETLAAAKNGRHSLSVLLTQGMNLKQLFIVVFTGTLAAAFAAFMTSAIVGAALNYIIYDSVTEVITAEGFVNWGAYGTGAGITAALALAISLLVAGINRMAFGKSKYKQEN